MMNARTLGLCGVVVLAAGSITLGAQRPQPQRYAPAYTRMSGTYQLESTRGDNSQRAADAATRSLPPDRRNRAYQSLLARLDRRRPLRSIATDR